MVGPEGTRLAENTQGAPTIPLVQNTKLNLPKITEHKRSREKIGGAEKKKLTLRDFVPV